MKKIIFFLFFLSGLVFAQQQEDESFWNEPLFQEEPLTRLEEAQAAQEKEEWADAALLYQKIIESPLDKDEYDQALYGLAYCYDKQGEVRKALKYYQTLVRQGKTEELKKKGADRIAFYEQFILGQFHVGDWYPKLWFHEKCSALAQSYPQYQWHFKTGLPYLLLILYKFFLFLLFLLLLLSSKKSAPSFNISWGLPSIFLIYTLFLILQCFLVLLLKPEMGGPIFVTLLFEVILSYLILTALVLCLLTIRGIRWRQLGIEVDHFGRNITLSIKYILAISILFGLYAFLRSYGIFGQDKVARSYPFASFGTLYHFFQAFLLLIVSPISEEIFYRGFIYPVVRNRSGILKAIILTSLFFALVHVDVRSMLVLFFLSMALCFLYEKTHNLIPAILVHSFYNFIVLFGGSFLPS